MNGIGEPLLLRKCEMEHIKKLIDIGANLFCTNKITVDLHSLNTVTVTRLGIITVYDKYGEQCELYMRPESFYAIYAEVVDD